MELPLGIALFLLKFPVTVSPLPAPPEFVASVCESRHLVVFAFEGGRVIRQISFSI